MVKRHTVFVLVAALGLATLPAAAAPDPGIGTPPTPEPRVVPGVSSVLPAGKCTPDSVFELTSSPNRNQPSYESCERLKVVFGPIWSKPGQNDVLIQPVTFEKPIYPGYLTRFKPDLVDVGGDSPRVKDVHLHHGTWLNAGGRSYGWGPWIASGEEKTIASWPQRFGLKIQESDTWLFLHMIHNATSSTFPVWVTYTMDFVPVAAGDAIQPDGKPLITGTKGIWLDVGDCSFSSECTKDRWNPVFNIQRGFGHDGVCVFPRENCAMQNTLAGVSAQQGKDVGVKYDDWNIPEDGTLVVMGGHLHYGGLRDDVYLARDLDGDGKIGEGETRLIMVSDGMYWDQNYNPNAATPDDDWDLTKQVISNEPSSWDMVMTGVTRDQCWSIQVKKGDKLRLEGIYDSSRATWYEEMGIVMSWLAPAGTSGIDPFAPGVTISTTPSTLATHPMTAPGIMLPGDTGAPGNEGEWCSPSATVLCVRGQPTHARIPTSGDHWKCELNGCAIDARRAINGPQLTDIHMAGFTYGQADLGLVELAGVPTTKVGSKVRFWNVDTADYMWHTVTRCAAPCSGTTSASYPQADGAWDDVVAQPPASITDPNARLDYTQARITEYVNANGPDMLDFDSGQVGVGTGANNKLYWDFAPTRPGTFTFFCRIHPSMRGAIRVLPA